jgi:predicted NAD-dependent protein-ADP-ribosyltransferase YbiA (DUF1768 family)
MALVVQAKFMENPSLMQQLLSVSGEIIEENRWGDKYWGMCQKLDHVEDQSRRPVYVLEGKNKLGKILMSIRDNEIARIQHAQAMQQQQLEQQAMQEAAQQ